MTTNPNIGTETMLDTARFRSLLGTHYGVDPRSVHAYIIGEHGDTEVLVWSSAHIGSLSIHDNTVLGKAFNPSVMERVIKRVRDAAYDIIDRKGYTNTAIGIVIAELVETVHNDQKSVLTVSSRLNGEYGQTNVCLSLPSVGGLDGMEPKILPELSELEVRGLEESAEFLRHGFDELSGMY